MRPNIIIHNRKDGQEISNFLIVECKKFGCSKINYNNDIKRIIELMKSEYGLMVLYKVAASMDAKFFWHHDNETASKKLNS